MGNKFEKFNPCCTYTPPVNWSDGFTPFEIVNKVIDYINDFIEYCNSLDARIEAKEDSINITNNRKLSETGNFTGTWYGETYASMNQKILDGQNAYQAVIDLINTNPEINIEIIDGGFFLDGQTPEVIDGGDFVTPITEEIDAGFFVYPCVYV